MAPEKPDRNYDTRSLNKIFAVGSIVLLVVVIGMVYEDYSREWKGFQRQFYRLETARTRAEIRQAERALNGAEMKRVRAEMAKAQAEFRKESDRHESLQEQLQRLDAEFYGRDLDYRFAKATYDSRKYDAELEIDNLRKAGKTSEAAGKQVELDRIKKEMDEAKIAFDDITARQEAVKAQLGKVRGRVDELQAAINKMTTDRERLSNKLERVESSFVNWLVNSPMLDFMAPTLQIQQVVLPKLRHDINFMEVPRVDRCMTCHTVINQPGYEKSPQPFRTHPNLGLYVAENSKHPVDSFGCTACHAGRDRGVSFTNAAHTPDNEKQKKEWEDKYGWEEMHYWETPMRSRSHYYAGCYGCHSDQAALASAAPADPKSAAGNLDRGLRTVEISGCHGCHKIRGLEGLRKAGPDLSHILSKASSDWAFRWIRNPRSFRSTTRMPGFFLQSNQQDSAHGNRPAAADLNDAEIEGIIAYLGEKSEPIQYREVPGGDSARGKQLVQSIGCLGCHTDNPEERFPHRADPRAFGPNLGGLGSKTNRQWLYHWLKDPKHYWPETNMPNLRLTDQEALDVTTYLLSLRNPEFDKIPVPRVSAVARDWLTRDFLAARMSLADAETRVKGMSEKEKKLYLGERAINKYGCFGCHDIKGFENAQPIGTELTEEGSKPVERLDYGLEEDTVERHCPGG
jgi:mono/diheme cytochrome c family protein